MTSNSVCSSTGAAAAPPGGTGHCDRGGSGGDAPLLLHLLDERRDLHGLELVDLREDFFDGCHCRFSCARIGLRRNARQSRVYRLLVDSVGLELLLALLESVSQMPE